MFEFEKLVDKRLSKIVGGRSEDVARNIKMLRVTAGMSRNCLADILNVDPTTVTHWEHSRRIPDVDMLIEISELFNTSVDNIVK